MSQRNQISLSANEPIGKKLLDSLQADLRTVSNESKRRSPQLKEAAEAGIVKLRSASSKHQDLRLALLSESQELLEPFLMACESKIPKMIQVSLGAIQRLISYEVVSSNAAISLVDCLWSLMEAELEELKLLQTVTLLISSNNVIHGDGLAKSLALCFRLHFTKNQTVNNAASATIRQLTSFVFERAQTEGENQELQSTPRVGVKYERLKTTSRNPPETLQPFAKDAFLLFQDFLQLVNGDQPFWLIGLVEMTRTFGLELLEIVLTNFPKIFYQHEEFLFLLKEKVCPLVIKLFSPNIKYKPHHQAQIQASQQFSNDSLSNNPNFSDKPIFPISIRLLRIVAVLVQNYYSLLITEGEIFLSLLIKFLENDKPIWQRALALEILHKMCQKPYLLSSFCQSYDMKQNSSKIFRDLIIAIGIFCQSMFLSPPITPSLLTSLINAASVASSSSTPPTSTVNANQINSNASISPQPAFSLRGIWVPLVFNLSLGQSKNYLVDQLDKLEPPSVPDGYGLTLAYLCLLAAVKSISSIIENPEITSKNLPSYCAESVIGKDCTLLEESSPSIPCGEKLRNIESLHPDVRLFHEFILNSSWTGLVAALSLLLDASTDEGTTESILKSMEKLASLYGLYGLGKPRDTIIIAMCRASLPAGYNLPLLNLDIPFNSENSSPTSLTPSESTTSIANSVSTCHSRSSSYDLSNHWAQSNLKLLSSSVGILQHAHNPPSSLNSIVQPRLSTQSDISDLRQQVVAVGTPLFSTQSSSSTSQLGPVMLTAKNLQCMKSVLTLSHSYGSTLESSWRVILTTLQHLAWILDLKPSTGGSLKVTKAGSDNSPVVGSNATGQSSTMPDLPVLSAMLSRLFESSQELSDDALMHLIDALCKLSWEAMENSYSNREPSLFAVAKLLETSLVNLNRRKILWVPVTDHLLKVCQHPQIKMREWGAEAMTCLVKNVLTLKDLEKNEKKLYLASLQSASSINHADIRQKQLDCVIQILQGSGESIGEGWPQILDIIGAINDSQSENLIRIAFQSLQLIIKDFLSSIPTLYLVLVVDTVGKFGSQTQEMNVALTAVSSLWDTADFLFQNRRTIEENLDDRNVPSGDDKKDPNSVLPAYDCLWMSLFAKLGDLCTDSRPSLRKSASQTLFATLTTHGEILDTRLWSAVLWQVLFPLLERVRLSTDSASDEKLVETSKLMGVNNMSTSSSSGSILLHHSRNTAHKQWSETQVLTLCGVIRIFCLKRDQFLSTIDHFERAWISLLSYIESSAQSKNIEVSLAALRGFKDVLCVSSPPSSHSLITPDQSSHDNNHFISQPFSKMSSSIPSSHKKLWSTAWKVWSNIGMHHMSYILNEPGNGEAHSTSNHRISKDDPNNSSGNLPSQAFLSSLIRIFPFIFSPIKDSFETDDFRKLFMIFEKCLSYPIDAATQTFMISTSSSISGPQDSNSHTIPLSPLQEAVIFVMETLQSDLLANLSLSESRCYVEKLLPTLINQFLIFSNYACYPPSQKSYNHSQNGKSIAMPDIAKLSLIPFGERCMKSALFLYQMTASSRHVIDGCIFHNIIKSLKTPLSLKYSCPSQSTWKLAHHCLIAGLTVGFPIARQYYSQKLDLWTDLGQVFESFLFTTSKPPNNQSLEDQQLDESLDVKIIELIRNNVLPFASQMPKEFVLQMVALLNRGSIHSSSTGSPTDTESSRRLREEFARHCFDTLLRFSFLSSKENPTIFLQASPKNSVPNDSSMEENGLVNRLVVTSLLQRFREVVIKYVEDEKLSGKCPLPRHRMAEITFVLQALATLASSMKKAPSEQVEQVVWNQMISLYPHLVDCTVSNNAQVNRALREVLQEYKDFLTPPQSRLIQRSSISNGT